MFSNFLSRIVLTGIAAAATVMSVAAAAELRVCADPNNLPFSNDQREGFENRIAEIIASDLNLTVSYSWLAQRGSFLRKSLTAGKCDVVLTVPSAYDGSVSLTKPYYASTYVFVYAKSREFELRSFDDPVLRKLKIGIHAFGEEGSSPAAIALGNRGIVGRIVGFSPLNSGESPSSRIIDAVALGEIDVAIVWGPLAGYFAKSEPVKLEVVPVSPTSGSLPFVFQISIAVRRGDSELKRKLEEVLDRKHSDIMMVLKDYGVPLVDDEHSSTKNVTGKDKKDAD